MIKFGLDPGGGGGGRGRRLAPAAGERRPHRKTPAAVLGSLKASFIYLYISLLLPSRRHFLSLSFLFFSHGAGKPFDCWRFAPLSISLPPSQGLPRRPLFSSSQSANAIWGPFKLFWGVAARWTVRPCPLFRKGDAVQAAAGAGGKKMRKLRL